MQKEDFLLMVVASGKDEPLTPVQLQKSLFLISEHKQRFPEVPESFYDFRPYHYGPFDIRVYQDADVLAEKGLVLRFTSNIGAWKDTVATHSGREKAEELMAQLNPVLKRYIREVVEWTQKLSFRELVGAIYQAYPDYRKNSVFQD